MTSYVYFITSQLAGPGGVIECMTSDSTDPHSCEGGTLIDRWWFLLPCCAIYIPLVMVRRVEVFAVTHIFADICIIATFLALCVYAGLEISDHGGI